MDSLEAMTVLGTVCSLIGTYYLIKDHNKKKQDSVVHNELVLNEKNEVKRVLLEFCNDWKSYSKSNEYYSNEDPAHIAFIGVDHRLKYHLDQFNLVSNKIIDLPKDVSDKLVDFVSRMRVMEARSDIVSSDAWSREYPSSLVNQFDELLADIVEMSTNLDEICSAT